MSTYEANLRTDPTANDYYGHNCVGTATERGSRFIHDLMEKARSTNGAFPLQIGYGTAEGVTSDDEHHFMGVVAAVVDGTPHVFSPDETRCVAKSIHQGLKMTPGIDDSFKHVMSKIADALMKSADIAENLDLDKLKN